MDTTTPAPSDLEFAYQLRDVITRYLASIDAWERQYGQTYRLASPGGRIGEDLAGEQAAYQAARRELEALVPRARLLYHRFGIREPFPALLRVHLGAAAPQNGTRKAIGGNERTEVARGLVDLIAACAPNGEPPPPRGEPRKPSVLRRIFSLLK